MQHRITEYMNQRIDTSIGPFRAEWSARGLRSFEFLREPQQFLWAQPSDLPGHCHSLRLAVDCYFESGQFLWDLDQLDWQDVSPFHRRVLRECYRIAPGTTLSYGELAAKVDSPGAARAVGAAMARNRWPLLIPCHRVVGSSGKLTGYSGVGGIHTKRQLLDLEAALC